LLERACRQAGRAVPQISPPALEKLRQYAWPGNVRELDNMMQRALILAGGDVIEVTALHFEQVRPSRSTSQALESREPVTLTSDLKDREYRVILEALQSGSRQSAAERLGISPRTLRYKLAQMREAGYQVDKKVGL
jgi:two-component system response regulator FlrC